MPGGIFRAGTQEHLVRGAGVLGPLITVTPVFIGDLVALPRDGLTLPEASQLFLRRDVQPEFEQYVAVVGQLMLKMIDLGIGAGPVFLGGQLFHPFHKDTAVPGTVIDGDETGAGDVPPETPQVMVRQLFIRRRADGDDTRDAGICPGSEAPDGSPLAGGIPAFKDECGRDAFFVRPERKLIDLLLQAF